MKMKGYFIIVMLICFTLLTNAQTQVSRDSKLFSEFLLNMEKWQDAYNGGDAQNLIPLYAEDAVYSSSHVFGLEAIGRDKLIANFQNGMRMGGHIDEIEILSANSSGDMASLFCRYKATNSGNTVSGRNFIVLRKVNRQWLIVNHMTVV
jgi:ketosteroid isomerase-like protein